MDSYGTRSLREIVRILFLHWFMMLVILVIGGVGTWYVCEYHAPRKYRSQVNLIYKRPLSKNPVLSDAVGERALEVFVKAQQQIVMSDLVLSRAKVIAEDDKLRKQWEALRDELEAAQNEVGGAVTDALVKITAFLGEGEKSPGTVAYRVKILMETEQEALRDFRKSVKLETPGGEQVGMTETFQITVDRPGSREVPGSQLNAKYAAELVADMYIARYQELQRIQNDPAFRVMEDVIKQFYEEFERRRNAYDAFIKAPENINDITGLEQLLKSGTEQGLQIFLTEIRKNDANLFLEMAKDQANFNALKKILPEQAFDAGFIASLSDDVVATTVNSIASEFMMDDVGFVELSKSMAGLEAKRARVESQFLEESRDYQYINEQINRLRRRMLEQIVAQARGLELRILSRQQQKIRNEELIAKTATDQSHIHAKLATYARLKNDFEISQKQLERLEQDRIDAMTNRLSAREAVTIHKLDRASTPDINRPVVPLTMVYTIVACAVSLLLGVTLAFLADHFDHTLRSSVDAERYLGVPVLGSVKKRGRRLVVPA